MADREVRYLFRNKKTSGSTLPNNYMVGEPFVNVYEGRMFFYGVEGGSYTPANGQTNVFEVGSNVGTLNAGVILSAGTNLYDIFLTEAPPGDFTRVQNGLNTYTGGTDNFPTVNVSAATLDNLSVSGVSSLGVVSATTIISGSTNLYDIFSVSDDITRVQNGLNTYTGGTDNYPTVNISAATLDNLSVSGASSLGIVSATTLTANTIYTHTISGMSPVYVNDVIVSNASISATSISLEAGTTSKPFVQLNSGELLTTVVPGAIEFKNDDMYISLNTPYSGTTYTSQYPPAYNSTYVKATTEYYNRLAHQGVDPSKSLIGDATSNSWNSDGTVGGMRFHIDLGSEKVINRIYYENSHNVGGSTNQGVKNFTLWGSNESSAFNELTYSADTSWAQITGLSQEFFDQHIAVDTPDSKYITFHSDTSYRYYAFKFSDDWGLGAYMGFRRVELQYGSVQYPRVPFVLADETVLTETKIPVAATNGRLIDSLISQESGVVSVSGDVSTHSISATTIVSGSTNLYDIFLTTHDGNDITRIQNGLNTYTGGTDNYPTVNISAATLDNLSVSGASSLGVVSATTIISGSTNLYDIFKMYSEDIILLSGSSWDSTAYTQTVAITSTTISDEAIIWVSPKNTRTDIQNYIDSEIIAVNNIFSAITFECVSIPTVNINVNIVIKNQ